MITPSAHASEGKKAPAAVNPHPPTDIVRRGSKLHSFTGDEPPTPPTSLRGSRRGSALRPADGLPTGTAESEAVGAPATEVPAAAEVPPGDAKPKRRASFVEPLLEA